MAAIDRQRWKDANEGFLGEEGLLEKKRVQTDTSVAFKMQHVLAAR